MYVEKKFNEWVWAWSSKQKKIACLKYNFKMNFLKI